MEVQCSLQFCMKLVDIAAHKIGIRKIGIINLMVILVIFLPFFVHKYMSYTSYNKEKYRKTNIIIIRKKIHLNDLGLQRWRLVSVAKLEYRKIGGSTVL